ncbi:hypothetical protein [Amycolatopsis pithecellobii]|uniref:hypothetical protein n=1 Tax=Amycolatopsis pithecellobii TaxID=664692 RepID=UPI001FE6A2A4|nr:hypothetical protein [Amycolatopsis pithecellobii]
MSATKRVAMRWWMTYPMIIVDCVFRALSEVYPDGAIAGHHADLGVALMPGYDPRTGRLFFTNFGPQGGGVSSERTTRCRISCRSCGRAANSSSSSTARWDSLPVASGTRVTVRTGGGGGYGDPRKRAAESVGVAVVAHSDDPCDFTIDADATMALRA